MISQELLTFLEIEHVVARNLEAFVVLFEKWNASINLSAASTPSEIIEHVEDSLHVVPLIRTAERVLDVGSGGGFPVVVAAICLPQTQFIALEPVHKKHAFLKTAARELRLSNLTAFAERLEAHDGRGYDVAMSRATFDIVEWFALAAPFVADAGFIVGFEAVPRAELDHFKRHPYARGSKQRSLITSK